VFHRVPPDAVDLRIAATCPALSVGFAAHTSAAAPATSGVEKDVPLDHPYRPAWEPGSLERGHHIRDEPAAIAPKTFSPGAASEM